MRIAKIMILLFIVAIPLGVVTWFFSTGGIFVCETTLLKEYSQLNTDVRVSVYEKDCGATTPIATHVAILRSNEEGQIIFVMRGRAVDLEVSWVAPKEVRIRNRGRVVDREDIFTRRDELHGIQIIYEGFAGEYQ